jgi:ring-1,2-phenylacetyl-CoA epoxidase subunit PaaC
MDANAALVDFLLGLGDDRLVLGHRLSEWCGHAPILEEDIALTNIALDLIGQANLFLSLAGDLEGKGRDADALAYFRIDREFRNHPLVELPKGDFAFTIMRQFLFDAFGYHLLQALGESGHEELRGIAGKSVKETAYHLRHSAEWVVRLGDGTDESHGRAQRALDEAWRWTGALFVPTPAEAALDESGVAPNLAGLEFVWRASVDEVMLNSTLELPEADPPAGKGYRRGDHTEHLGTLLAEMQSLARAHPGATW